MAWSEVLPVAPTAALSHSDYIKANKIVGSYRRSRTLCALVLFPLAPKTEAWRLHPAIGLSNFLSSAQPNSLPRNGCVVWCLWVFQFIRPELPSCFLAFIRGRMRLDMLQHKSFSQEEANSATRMTAASLYSHS